MMDISELAYELYKIDWLRRISPERQMDNLKDYYDETHSEDADYDEDWTYEDHLFEYGFDGESYVCYDEFLENEYLDEAYMRSLLNESQFEEYKKDIKELEDE